MNVLITEALKFIPGVFGIHLDEHAPYEILKSGEIEIRRYSPMTLATVSARGSHEVAINKGFAILAKYFFSHNIPMTVPVFQKIIPGGVEIAFFIPEAITPPMPSHPDVLLVHHKERMIACLPYTGVNLPKAMKRAQARLDLFLKMNQKFSAVQDFFWAQYDSPMTIPFLRKNEAMVEIRTIS